MKSRRSILWLLPIVAIFVFADERIKLFALTHFPGEGTVPNPGILQLAIHKNWGIAFDIPFKMPLIVIVSVVISIALAWVAKKNLVSKPSVAVSALMILIGAAGNFYDRLAYGFTVDYIILFGRSAINLSDIVIVAGVISLLYASRVRGPHRHGSVAHDDEECEEEETVDKDPSA